MIMLGSDRENEYGKLIVQPTDAGAVTQAPYVVVADVDTHYARAKAAGAEIVIAISDQGYGGRLYASRDPEGRVWNFGSCDPWA